jgi:hypothetical protein
MERSSLPLIAPQYEARYISAGDVLALLGYGEVPGVNYQDSRVQEIRSCVLGNLGRVGLTTALNAGYVHDRGSALQDGREPLLTAWRWWCTAAGHPHIVLSSDGKDLHQVRCDLVSAGKRWNPTDVPHFERILGEVTTVWMPESRFRVDDRVFEITGVEMDDAITIARNLVEYTTTGQFKQRPTERVRDSDPMFVHMRPMGPIERSDD